jgi:hypothetical protein
MDLINFTSGGTLENNVKDFGDGRKLKGVFPYEAINTENFVEYLSQTTIPPKEDYYSRLNRKGISNAEYNEKIEEWKTRGFKNRLEELEYYNKNDKLIGLGF